jgi:hypothetical protein
MRNHSWLKMAGVALLGLVLAAGCVETVLLSAGAAGAIGTYKWIEGTMEKDYPKPMQETWNAVLAAAKDMNMRVATQQYGPLESRIEAVQPPDTNVKIQLVARPNQITTVKVRFGLMGNTDASAYFHRRVLHHLHMAPE